MNLFKKGSFWAILTLALGILLFAAGTALRASVLQYAGAFFIAVGIFITDAVISSATVGKKSDGRMPEGSWGIQRKAI